MSSPFDPQPLTAAQQQQVADNISGNLLIKEALAELALAKVDFSATLAKSVELTKATQNRPAIEVDVEGLLVQEAEFIRLSNLVRNLGYYLGGAQGWRLGVGQSQHETFEQLKTRLKGLYPDAGAAVERMGQQVK